MLVPEGIGDWAGLPFFLCEDENGMTEWDRLSARLAAETNAGRQWQPQHGDIFRALRLTPPNGVRAVILGQDPYHTEGRATGLAFSFPPDCRPKDSLANILAELHDDLTLHRVNGDLTSWSGQGVLLLNKVLTVPVGVARGHAGFGWEALTHQIIAHLAGARAPIAFLLWGDDARAVAREIPDRHLVLEAGHPSRLNRSPNKPFRGTRPFSAVNAWLAAQGQPPINWAA